MSVINEEKRESHIKAIEQSDSICSSDLNPKIIHKESERPENGNISLNINNQSSFKPNESTKIEFQVKKQQITNQKSVYVSNSQRNDSINLKNGNLLNKLDTSNKFGNEVGLNIHFVNKNQFDNDIYADESSSSDDEFTSQKFLKLGQNTNESKNIVNLALKNVLKDNLQNLNFNKELYDNEEDSNDEHESKVSEKKLNKTRDSLNKDLTEQVSTFFYETRSMKSKPGKIFLTKSNSVDTMTTTNSETNDDKLKKDTGSFAKINEKSSERPIPLKWNLRKFVVKSNKTPHADLTKDSHLGTNKLKNLNSKNEIPNKKDPEIKSNEQLNNKETTKSQNYFDKSKEKNDKSKTCKAPEFQSEELKVLETQKVIKTLENNVKSKPKTNKDLNTFNSDIYDDEFEDELEESSKIRANKKLLDPKTKIPNSKNKNDSIELSQNRSNLKSGKKMDFEIKKINESHVVRYEEEIPEDFSIPKETIVNKNEQAELRIINPELRLNDDLYDDELNSSSEEKQNVQNILKSVDNNVDKKPKINSKKDSIPIDKKSDIYDDEGSFLKDQVSISKKDDSNHLESVKIRSKKVSKNTPLILKRNKSKENLDSRKESHSSSTSKLKNLDISRSTSMKLDDFCRNRIHSNSMQSFNDSNNDSINNPNRKKLVLKKSESDKADIFQEFLKKTMKKKLNS